MINFLEETLDMLKDCGKTEDDVLWVDSLDERRISGLFVICGSDPVLEKEGGIEEFRITEDRISSSGIGNCFRAFLMKRIREKLGITEIYISG